MNNTGTSSERYHSLDSLRAVMMMLGVLLHIICGYATLRDVWWYKDATTSPAADFMILFIHIFRLPVFFVMAGFLGGLLYTKRGWRSFAANRTRRLFLPFVLFLAVLYPILEGISGYRWSQAHGEANPVQGAISWITGARCWSKIHPTHLWFLEYLLISCAIAIVAAPLLDRVLGCRASAWFRAALTSRWRALIFAIPTVACLLAMENGLLDTPHNFVPVPRIVVAYTLFFGFGWALYFQRDLLSDFSRGIGWNLSTAFLLATVNFFFLVRRSEDIHNPLWFWGIAVTGGVAVWLIIFGATGLFVRNFSRPSTAMRYLSDSAYWQYLMHPPLVFVFQLMVAQTPLPWWAKSAVVTIATFPVLIASYEWGVRSTWVGVLLNGRRYPRATATPMKVLVPELNQGS